MQDLSYPPGLQKFILPRPRIDALLDRAFQDYLIVLYAGPGFGKTTAISQYLAKSDYLAVWFDATSADNIPARFWEHLMDVFSKHKTELGKKMEDLGFPDTPQKLSQFIIDLTDELYQDENSVVFIFDNVNSISDPSVLSFLENMVNVRLENSNIVLITRQWPLFENPITVTPQIINTTQLQYTLEETTAYMTLAGVNLPSDTINDIQHYISGWPMALSLVLYSITNGVQQDIPDFSITKPSLFNLIDRLIFSHYTKEEQNLLIIVSLLDSHPRDLVRVVSGSYERDLMQLMNDNIFLKYDATTQRISFHPLYVEFLREKMRSVSPQELKEAYKKAADWCLQNEHYHDAVQYYRKCEQYQQMWEVLLRMNIARHSFSEAQFFIQEIESMPEEFKRENLMTKLVLAVMFTSNSRFEEAIRVLGEVEDQLFDKDGEAVSLHAMQAPKKIAVSPEQNQLVPTTEADQTPKPPSTNILGEYYLAKGLFAFAYKNNGFEEFFEKAAELLPQGSRYWDNRFQLIDLGPITKLHNPGKGELQKSLERLEKAVPYMVQTMNGAGLGLDALCESESFFLLGDTKQAIEPAYRALYLAAGVSQYDIVGNALFMLLRCYVSQGKYDMVLETLRHVERYEADIKSRNLGIWDIIRSWFSIDVGELESVASWIRDPMQKGSSVVSLDRSMIIHLRYLISAGQFSEALAIEYQFEALAKNNNAVIMLLYAYLGRAVAYNSLGNIKEAADSLKNAYELAIENQLSMPFIEYGSKARSLFEHVRQTKGHDIPEKWLNEMFSKSSTYAKRLSYVASRYRQEKSGKQEKFHLSPREAELLSNLSQGLTREEAAEAMNLSLNTVKSLTKQAFAKLGAINIAHAVRIAIANGLI